MHWSARCCGGQPAWAERWQMPAGWMLRSGDVPPRGLVQRCSGVCRYQMPAAAVFGSHQHFPGFFNHFFQYFVAAAVQQPRNIRCLRVLPLAGFDNVLYLGKHGFGHKVFRYVLFPLEIVRLWRDAPVLSMAYLRFHMTERTIFKAVGNHTRQYSILIVITNIRSGLPAFPRPEKIPAFSLA